MVGVYINGYCYVWEYEVIAGDVETSAIGQHRVLK